MLYLFCTGETNDTRHNVVCTLARQTDALNNYIYGITGPPKQLGARLTQLRAIDSGIQEDCLIVYYDENLDCFFPLRKGKMHRVSLLRKNGDETRRKISEIAKSGQAVVMSQVSLGDYVSPYSFRVFQAVLRATFKNIPLPGTPAGNFVIQSHSDLTPSLYTGDKAWLRATEYISRSHAFARSNENKIFIKTAVLPDEEEGGRILQVQGINYASEPKAVSVVQGVMLTRFQTAFPKVPFEFFVSLPDTPSALRTVVVDAQNRLPLCEVY